MPRLQTKIIAFLFLLIVAVPVFISVKFIVEENLIKQGIDEKMNSTVLQSVRISKADVIWLIAGKEILLDDKLFDVKYFESTNGIVTFTGFFDTEETKLLEAFKTYADTNDPENPLTELAFKFLFSPVYNSYYEIVYHTSPQAILNKYYSFDEMLPAAPSIPFTQPPKL